MDAEGGLIFRQAESLGTVSLRLAAGGAFVVRRRRTYTVRLVLSS
jgi:hypothetical protein